MGKFRNNIVIAFKCKYAKINWFLCSTVLTMDFLSFFNEFKPYHLNLFAFIFIALQGYNLYLQMSNGKKISKYKMSEIDELFKMEDPEYARNKRNEILKRVRKEKIDTLNSK